MEAGLNFEMDARREALACRVLSGLGLLNLMLARRELHSTGLMKELAEKAELGESVDCCSRACVFRFGIAFAGLACGQLMRMWSDGNARI